MQWTMAKGHTIGRTVVHQMDAKVAHIDMEELEAQRLNPDGPDQLLAPKGPLNNLGSLINWSQDFLNRHLPLDQNVQVNIRNEARNQGVVYKNSRGGHVSHL
jgi:hypothetical protein